jgi:hypothetical protein
MSIRQFGVWIKSKGILRYVSTPIMKDEYAGGYGFASILMMLQINLTSNVFTSGTMTGNSGREIVIVMLY